MQLDIFTWFVKLVFMQQNILKK